MDQKSLHEGHFVALSLNSSSRLERKETHLEDLQPRINLTNLMTLKGAYGPSTILGLP